jgi:hypothetical protein
MWSQNLKYSTGPAWLSPRITHHRFLLHTAERAPALLLNVSSGFRKSTNCELTMLLVRLKSALLNVAEFERFDLLVEQFKGL